MGETIVNTRKTQNKIGKKLKKEKYRFATTTTITTSLLVVARFRRPIIKSLVARHVYAVKKFADDCHTRRKGLYRVIFFYYYYREPTLAMHRKMFGKFDRGFFYFFY